MVIGQDYGSFPKIESEDKDGKKKNTEYYFEECICRDVIYYEYELEYSKDKAIHVFPVYHPGSNSNMNRPLQETGTNEEGQSQESDWGKIRDFLRKIAKKYS